MRIVGVIKIFLSGVIFGGGLVYFLEGYIGGFFGGKE